MTEGELATIARQKMKGLSSKFNSEDYTNAINDAARDTGWTMPVSTDFKEKWMLERTRRHLFSYLRDESAKDFKYKQINLQHRFKHYDTLVKDADLEFRKAIEENLHEFAGVDVHKLFGSILTAGFAYEDQTGKDITYDPDQQVIVTPYDDD